MAYGTEKLRRKCRDRLNKLDTKDPDNKKILNKIYKILFNKKET